MNWWRWFKMEIMMRRSSCSTLTLLLSTLLTPRSLTTLYYHPLLWWGGTHAVRQHSSCPPVHSTKPSFSYYALLPSSFTAPTSYYHPLSYGYPLSSSTYSYHLPTCQPTHRYVKTQTLQSSRESKLGTQLKESTVRRIILIVYRWGSYT